MCVCVRVCVVVTEKEKERETEREREGKCVRESTGRCVCYRGNGKRECENGGMLSVIERESWPGWFTVYLSIYLSICTYLCLLSFLVFLSFSESVKGLFSCVCVCVCVCVFVCVSGMLQLGRGDVLVPCCCGDAAAVNDSVW